MKLNHVGDNGLVILNNNLQLIQEYVEEPHPSSALKQHCPSVDNKVFTLNSVLSLEGKALKKEKAWNLLPVQYFRYGK